jgi:hypothetical protein
MRRLLSNCTYIAIRCLLTAIIAVSVSIPYHEAHAQLLSIFGPKDYEDCAERAAKDAKTNNALSILLQNCNTSFPARRKPGGGYVYYEEVSQTYLDVSGPRLSKADKKLIEQHISDAVKREVRKSEELVRQAELLMQRIDTAKDKLNITKTELLTEGEYYCIKKTLRVYLKNNSTEVITGVKLGFSYVGRNQKHCPTSLPGFAFRNIRLSPSQTGVVSITSFALCGAQEQSSYCVDINNLDIK